MSEVHQVVNSALWAAYGDVLGFITELADKSMLEKRIHGTKVTKPVAWTRRVGGRFGVSIELPAGCYSDDTQLRLATSRSIRGDGMFDVEAFSKIELPVWLSYQLGGGRGTKSASFALTRRSTTWMTNFFEKESRYVESGGNGAAMRIQPHIWATTSLDNPKHFLRDVIRNAVCTHGHPRGILGAVFHAYCLADTLTRRKIPGPAEWRAFLGDFRIAGDVIRGDDQLATFWLPRWEATLNQSIDNAIESVAVECLADVDVVVQSLHSPTFRYAQLLNDLGGLSSENRGSGTKTALLAAVVAWASRDEPERGLLLAANSLGSDTDTIASMAGALLGGVATAEPDGSICDLSYIRQEAERLWNLSQGRPQSSFCYPSLVDWEPPSGQMDAVGEAADGEMAVAGLGIVRSAGDSYDQPGKTGGVWQWLELGLGQTILAKRRRELAKLSPALVPHKVTEANKPVERQVDVVSRPEPQEDLFGRKLVSKGVEELRLTKRVWLRSLPTIDEATDEVIRSRFDAQLIGEYLRRFASNENGIEQAVAFTSIVVKAMRARLREDGVEKRDSSIT